MISKELLSEVLDIRKNCEYVHEEAEVDGLNECVVIGWYGEDYFDVNIHELAHKCKEWALDNQFIITTHPCLTEEKWRNTSVRLLHFYSSGMDRIIEQSQKDKRFEADTEVEAIFKACQWILDNKDK
jgi:hypothetical protein